MRSISFLYFQNVSCFFRYFLFVLFISSYYISADDGDLDPTFDGDGRATISIGSTAEAFGVALQTDGKIVLAGKSDTDWAIARLNADGSLDTTGFGNPNGYVLTDFGGSDEQARGVAIQTDQKIVVAGYANIGSGGTYDFVLARYNTDGSLDTTFGTGGVVTTNFTGVSNDQAFGVALQTDGKIVAVGASSNSFAVARYNTNGSLDTTFGTSGRVTTDPTGIGGISTARSVAIQVDGKIVVVGEANFAGNFRYTTIRYNTNGSLDTTFGTGGIVTQDLTASSDVASGVVIQGDGKIVVAGTAGVFPPQFGVVRYNTNGTLDTSSFAPPNGFVFTSIGTGAFGNSVTLQSDSRIVVVGSAIVSGATRFAVARYTTSGSLDTSFGGTGTVTTSFGGSSSSANAVVIQPDQKIVAAGRLTINEGNIDFAAARYIGIDPCKLLVGSDTVLRVFTTQQVVAQGGRLAKLAFLNGGFGLCGDATFASCLPVAGSVCLECFTLTLENDLTMHNVSYIGSTGNIIGAGHVFDLAESMTVIPTFICTATAIQPAEQCIDIEWGNLTVRLNGNVILNDTFITFTGESAIRGNGHSLTLNNAGLIVGANASLLFDDVIINNVHDGVIRCIDSSSKITLYDTQWLLDNDFTFSVGSFDVIGTFDVVGDGYLFVYQSPAISMINQNGIMRLNRGLTFKYDPLIASRNLLQYIDSSSQLILDGATLHSTRTGLQLTRGELVVDQKSFILSEAVVKAEGVMFGDGIDSENNLKVSIAPAATLEVTEGFLVEADA